jgi:hypothetical protein
LNIGHAEPLIHILQTIFHLGCFLSILFLLGNPVGQLRCCGLNLKFFALKLKAKSCVFFLSGAKVALKLLRVVVACLLIELNKLGLRLSDHCVNVVKLLGAGGKLAISLCLKIGCLKDLLGKTTALLTKGQELALEDELGITDVADFPLFTAGCGLREGPFFAELFAIFARGHRAKPTAYIRDELCLFFETQVAELMDVGACRFD